MFFSYVAKIIEWISEDITCKTNKNDEQTYANSGKKQKTKALELKNKNKERKKFHVLIFFCFKYSKNESDETKNSWEKFQLKSKKLRSFLLLYKIQT